MSSRWKRSKLARKLFAKKEKPSIAGKIFTIIAVICFIIYILLII
jgi:hypothetical protein